jgi:hypothetical protein
VNRIRLGNELNILVVIPMEKHLFEPIPVGKWYSHETGFCENPGIAQKKVARITTGSLQLLVPVQLLALGSLLLTN